MIITPICPVCQIDMHFVNGDNMFMCQAFTNKKDYHYVYLTTNQYSIECVIDNQSVRVLSGTHATKLFLIKQVGQTGDLVYVDLPIPYPNQIELLQYVRRILNLKAFL